MSSKNGTFLGEAYTLPQHLTGATVFYPACTVKNAELKFNFGSTPFKFPPLVRTLCIAHTRAQAEREGCSKDATDGQMREKKKNQR